MKKNIFTLFSKQYIKEIFKIFILFHCFFFDITRAYITMRALSLWARSRSMIDRDAQIRVTDHSKMSFLIDKCMAKFTKNYRNMTYHKSSNN